MKLCKASLKLRIIGLGVKDILTDREKYKILFYLQALQISFEPLLDDNKINHYIINLRISYYKGA